MKMFLYDAKYMSVLSLVPLVMLYVLYVREKLSLFAVENCNCL